MAVARNTGYAPNGDPIPGNELPDILLDLDAHRRGKEFPDQDTLSWVADLRDRMDAEYYQPYVAAPAVSPRSLLGGCLPRRTQGVSEQLEVYNIEDVINGITTIRVKVGELLEETKELTRIQPEVKYRICGVRGKGKGVFVREEKIRERDQAAKSASITERLDSLQSFICPQGIVRSCSRRS